MLLMNGTTSRQLEGQIAMWGKLELRTNSRKFITVKGKGKGLTDHG